MMLEHPTREAVSDVEGAGLALIERNQFRLVLRVEHPLELLAGLRQKLGSKTIAVCLGQAAHHRHLPPHHRIPAGPHPPPRGGSPVIILIGKKRPAIAVVHPDNLLRLTPRGQFDKFTSAGKLAGGL